MSTGITTSKIEVFNIKITQIETMNHREVP